MNKKQVKTLCLFLSLIFIILAITTVSATDTDETADTPIISDENTNNIATIETNNNDNILTKNYDYKSLNIKSNDVKDTNISTNIKSLEKNGDSNNKNAVQSTLTVGSSKNVYVGNQMSIYGKLSSYGKDLPYQNIIITVDGKTYSQQTTQYGNYNIKITPTTQGTKTITAKYPGTNTYNSATATSTFTANKKSSKITVGSSTTVYVGNQMSIYGKLTDNNGKDIANQQITITADGKTYTTTTTQYGNYNIKITPTTQGTKTITAKYLGTNTYNSATATSTFMANKKTSLLTLGSTKSAYLRDSVSVYGKLTADGKNLANQKVNINIAGTSYTVTTSQYGNYNLIVTANSEGYNSITASYSGNNAFTSSSNSTYFNAKKKASTLTVGCTNPVYIGDDVCIYGKLTANGKNLAYKDVKLNVNGDYYSVTTSAYGNYKIYLTPYFVDEYSITATYDGDYYTTKSTARTKFNVKDKISTISLNIYPIRGSYVDTIEYVDGDYFQTWYQTYDAQDSKGVHFQAYPVDGTDMGDPSHNLIVDATFYFKNNAGKIYSDSYDYGDGTYMYHGLVSGYTPYKVVVSYRKMTEHETDLWNDGYYYNPRTKTWNEW